GDRLDLVLQGRGDAHLERQVDARTGREADAAPGDLAAAGRATLAGRRERRVGRDRVAHGDARRSGIADVAERDRVVELGAVADGDARVDLGDNERRGRGAV